MKPSLPPGVMLSRSRCGFSRLSVVNVHAKRKPGTTGILPVAITSPAFGVPEYTTFPSNATSADANVPRNLLPPLESTPKLSGSLLLVGKSYGLGGAFFAASDGVTAMWLRFQNARHQAMCAARFASSPSMFQPSRSSISFVRRSHSAASLHGW